MTFTKELNQLCPDTLLESLGIEFMDSGDQWLKARMPVDKRTRQPMGILHGGASLALAETLAGAGSLALIDQSKYNVVGMQVNANHIGSATHGFVWATATLAHKGSRTHVWDVLVSAEDGRKVSICRVTNMLVEKK